MLPSPLYHQLWEWCWAYWPQVLMNECIFNLLCVCLQYCNSLILRFFLFRLFIRLQHFAGLHIWQQSWKMTGLFLKVQSVKAIRLWPELYLKMVCSWLPAQTFGFRISGGIEDPSFVDKLLGSCCAHQCLRFAVAQSINSEREKNQLAISRI